MCKIYGFDIKKFTNFVASTADINDAFIKQVDLERTFAFFQVDDKQVAKQIIQALDGIVLNNRKIRIELSLPKRSHGRFDRFGSKRRPSHNGGSKGRRHRAYA